MNKLSICLLGSVFMLCVACGSGNPEEEQLKVLMGKTIELPEEIRCVSSGYDTQADDIEKEYKIVTYIDAISCNECALKILGDWQILLDDLSSEQKTHTGFVCLVNSINMSVSDSALTHLQIPIPVYYDIPNAFIQNNELYIDAKYRTFLLDRENRVVLVGSPIGNPRMWTLYKETIAKLIASGGELPDSSVQSVAQ